MKQAFSLVELSIVLVILGLLVGGILTGQSLIRAAELRSVTTEYSQYQTAIMTFRDKYFALPGDMDNATDFWGAQSSCGHQDASTDGTTCSGDGDGQLWAGGEGYRFWQHMANAGLIEGSYTGASGPDQTLWDVVPGVNTPLSKLSSGTWNALSIYYDNGGSDRYPAIGGTIPSSDYAYGINQLQFGADNGGGNYATAPVLTPEELWNIDTKMDDGKPGTGHVIAMRYHTCTDAADQFEAASSTANYLLSSDDVGCSIIFMPKGTGM